MEQLCKLTLAAILSALGFAHSAVAEWTSLGALDSVVLGADSECDYRVKIANPNNDIVFAFLPLDRKVVDPRIAYLSGLVDDKTLSFLAYHMPFFTLFPRGSATPKRSLAREVGHVDEVMLVVTLEAGQPAEVLLSVANFARRGGRTTEEVHASGLILEKHCT